MPATRPLAERFWEKVDKQGPIGPYLDTQCWTWKASKNKRGYGLIGIAASRPAKAHRVSWILNLGEIPDNMFVLHRCHNTSCVNPEHLYLGTHLENSSDRVATHRQGALFGSRHPNSILAEADVYRILELRSLGRTATSIAKEFGVRPTTVTDICAGRSWCHVSKSQFNNDLLRPGPLNGPKHPNHKITSEKLFSICLMRQQGHTFRHISEILGISTAAIFKAHKRYCSFSHDQPQHRI